MIVSASLCALSWILSIVAIAGSSTSDDTVKNTAWTIQDTNGLTIYYGTVRFVGETISINYSDCVTNECDNCEIAGKNANNCAIFTFVFTFIFFGLSIARISWDKVLFKAVFVVLGLVNTLVMIIGMGNWGEQCVNDYITQGGK